MESTDNQCSEQSRQVQRTGYDQWVFAWDGWETIKIILSMECGNKTHMLNSKIQYSNSSVSISQFSRVSYKM
jgi:hypothetical protein